MKAVAVSSESCVVSSVRTNFLFNLCLALHQSACYLLAKRVKKEQQSKVHCQKAAIRELQPLAIIIVRIVHSVRLLFVRSALILEIRILV